MGLLTWLTKERVNPFYTRRLKREAGVNMDVVPDKRLRDEEWEELLDGLLTKGIEQTNRIAELERLKMPERIANGEVAWSDDAAASIVRDALDREQIAERKLKKMREALKHVDDWLHDPPGERATMEWVKNWSGKWRV